MSEIIIYYRQMHVSGLLINWNFVKLEYFLKKIHLHRRGRNEENKGNHTTAQSQLIITALKSQYIP